MSVTLDEIRTMTPARAVSDDELTAALNACLDRVEAALRAGHVEFAPDGAKAGGEWHDELRRLMTTYAPYFAARVTGRRSLPHV